MSGASLCVWWLRNGLRQGGGDIPRCRRGPAGGNMLVRADQIDPAAIAFRHLAINIAKSAFADPYHSNIIRDDVAIRVSITDNKTGEGAAKL